MICITKLFILINCLYTISFHINFVHSLVWRDSINLQQKHTQPYRKNYNHCLHFLYKVANSPIFNQFYEYNTKLFNRRNDRLHDYTTYEKILQESNLQPLNLPEKYYILAIETSCDDTAVAILDNFGNVLSEYIKTQSHMIEKYKGIHPLESKIQHEQYIIQGIEKVLNESKISVSDIGFIAATRGPGLELCLMIGYNTALEFGKQHNIPVIASNHLASHCLTPIYNTSANQLNSITSKKLQYPFLALLLSGGHSQIYVVTSPVTYFILSDSIDTYMGSSLDKAARMLGLFLGNNGAPSLEMAAELGLDRVYSFREPLCHTHACQFSFSGINSQLERYIALELDRHGVESADKLPKNVIYNLAKGVQSITISHVITQLEKAMDIAETFFDINKLVVVGGVACNKELRRRLNEFFRYKNTYEYQREASNRFINRHLNVIRKFRNCNRTSKDNIKNMATNDLISKLWNGDISYIYPSNSTLSNKSNIAYVFDNEKWNYMLNSYLTSIGSLEIQKIVNGLIKINGKSLNNIIDIAKVSSKSLLHDVINLNNSLLPKEFNVNTIGDRVREWIIYVPDNNRCRDNAPMAAWSILEKLNNNLSVYSVDKIDSMMTDVDESRIKVYDKWHLATHRNLDIICDICKIDAVKLLYEDYNYSEY